MNGHACPRCGAVTLRLGICSQCAQTCEAVVVAREVTPCTALTKWDAERYERYTLRGAGGHAIKREGDVWVGE